MSTTQNTDEALKTLTDILIDHETPVTRSIAWVAKAPTPYYRCKHCGKDAVVEVLRSVTLAHGNEISDPEVRFVCNTCGVIVDLMKVSKETLCRFFVPVDTMDDETLTEEEALEILFGGSSCAHKHEHHKKHCHCKCKKGKEAKEARKKCQSKTTDPSATRGHSSLDKIFENIGQSWLSSRHNSDGI